MPFKSESSAAIQAVIKACRLCRQVQCNLVNEDTLAKKDRSPVTVADYGVQAIVTADLARAFPHIPMVGEEDAAALRADDGANVRARVVEQVTSVEPHLSEHHILLAIDYGTHQGGAVGQYWVLDPIDGTKGFLRGGQFAVALALVDNGRVVLGVLGCPNLAVDSTAEESSTGCVFSATIGEGAMQRNLTDNAAGEARTIRVSDVQDTADASFCESVETGHTDQAESAAIAARLGVTAPPYRIDSQCKYAAIARGDSAIYLRMPTREDYEEQIWDHAAGSIIVTEAGGTVTDMYGESLDFTRGRTLAANRGIVATNGHLHDPVVNAVRHVHC